MRLSSFDTGESTGIAVVDLSCDELTCKVVRTLTATPDQLKKEVGGIISKSDIVLVERIPMSSRPMLHAIQDIVFKSTDRKELIVEVIFPGIWKPISKARKWNCGSKYSQHEKDAYNLLRYYVFTQLAIDIGDLV